ncbi:hypothetical protein [Nonomuraea phyllanthi]|nr:hypothetical protein [Nonomuraea phyllanthi]
MRLLLRDAAWAARREVLRHGGAFLKEDGCFRMRVGYSSRNRSNTLLG